MNTNLSCRGKGGSERISFDNIVMCNISTSDKKVKGERLGLPG